METADRNKRVLEILTRKDQLVTERADLDEQRGKLAEEEDTLDAELRDLIGSPPPVNGERKQMTCSVCGEKGHNKSRHTKEE